MSDIDNLVDLCVANHEPKELALGWLRYECVRRMSARQFAELGAKCLDGGHFDEMVTEVLLERKVGK